MPVTADYHELLAEHDAAMAFYREHREANLQRILNNIAARRSEDGPLSAKLWRTKWSAVPTGTTGPCPYDTTVPVVGLTLPHEPEQAGEQIGLHKVAAHITDLQSRLGPLAGQVIRDIHRDITAPVHLDFVAATTDLDERLDSLGGVRVIDARHWIFDRDDADTVEALTITPDGIHITWASWRRR